MSARAAEHGISWGGYGLDHKVGHLRVAFQRGDWDVAGRIAASVGPAVSAGVAGLVAAAGLLVPVARGELDEAEARIRTLGTEHPVHDQTVLLLGQAGAECALWRGEPETAAGRVDAALRGLRLEVPYHLGELMLSALGIAAHADRAAAGARRAPTASAPRRTPCSPSAETVGERGLPRGTAIGPEGRAWLLQARAEHTRAHDAPSPEAWTAVIDAFGYGDRYRQACARYRRAEALLALAGRAYPPRGSAAANRRPGGPGRACGAPPPRTCGRRRPSPTSWAHARWPPPWPGSPGAPAPRSRRRARRGRCVRRGAAGRRRHGRARSADPARARRAGAGRARADQPADRRGAVHQREDGQRPPVPADGEAGRERAGGGRVAGVRAGTAAHRPRRRRIDAGPATVREP